ncbi:hypothetical protein Poli38472_003296 [Pythium oligandrum]|uniref:DUF1279 domain-containing protein n=1 Tax=Pythium oligandrum TaxID=41045 RepID=A0A8K1C6L3_PYTOL|nr:hypothetical protein Poli38472_003296 [Pythium oligandrum]|eukprot:TMW57371.1 hypothetical protein Poli38472_003296 [Pythium oligandrum]
MMRSGWRHSSHDAHGTSQETDPLKSDVTPPSPSTMENAELNEAATDAIAEPRSWRERAQTFALEYGRVGVCTHIVLSIFSFSVIYVGVSSGVDVSGLLESVGFSPKNSTQDSAANSAGSFLIAYTVYKLLSPVRWPLTFAVTPVVMRALRRRGYMLPKPVKPHGSPVPPEASPRRGNGNNDQGTAL